MRLEYDDISLWYGIPDTPAPERNVQAGVGTSITVGMRPANASDNVEVLCRINGGPIERMDARLWANDPLYASPPSYPRLATRVCL